MGIYALVMKHGALRLFHLGNGSDICTIQTGKSLSFPNRERVVDCNHKYSTQEHMRFK